MLITPKRCMIVRVLLLLNGKGNIEHWRQVFKITFSHIISSFLLFVCFFLMERTL